MRRSINNNNQNGFAIFDMQQDQPSRCSICYNGHSKLVNPCQCALQYHQKCLLHFIKHRLKSVGPQADFSQIKCRTCKTQIKFLFYQHNFYSLNTLCTKLKGNPCNKTIMIMIILAIIIIAMSIILSEQTHKNTVYYALLAGVTTLGLIMLVFIVIFMQNYVQKRELVLVKVYDYAEFMRNGTHSDEDSPQHEGALQVYDIVINQQE